MASSSAPLAKPVVPKMHVDVTHIAHMIPYTTLLTVLLPVAPLSLLSLRPAFAVLPTLAPDSPFWSDGFERWWVGISFHAWVGMRVDDREDWRALRAFEEYAEQQKGRGAGEAELAKLDGEINVLKARVVDRWCKVFAVDHARTLFYATHMPNSRPGDPQQIRKAVLAQHGGNDQTFTFHQQPKALWPTLKPVWGLNERHLLSVSNAARHAFPKAADSPALQDLAKQVYGAVPRTDCPPAVAPPARSIAVPSSPSPVAAFATSLLSALHLQLSNQDPATSDPQPSASIAVAPTRNFARLCKPGPGGAPPLLSSLAVRQHTDDTASASGLRHRGGSQYVGGSTPGEGG